MRTAAAVGWLLAGLGLAGRARAQETQGGPVEGVRGTASSDDEPSGGADEDAPRDLLAEPTPAARFQPGVAQFHAALLVGAAGRGPEGDIGQTPAVFFGSRADAMFFRESPHDIGLGPYVDVTTTAFDRLQFGGGLSALWPVLDGFPVVTSIGADGHYRDGFALSPGVSGALFWGYRSFNFHGDYSLAFGATLGVRHAWGPLDETTLYGALQLDWAALALPFMLLGQAAAGP